MTTTLPLTDPELFLKRLGEFIPEAFGEIAVPPGKLGAYNRACQDALLIQADALADIEKVTVDEARAMIETGEGTHDDIQGFSELLKERLPANFFNSDVVDDALELQAYGRLIFMMNNQIAPSQIVPVKWNENNPSLDAAQKALSGAQIRRLAATRNPTADHHDLRIARNGLMGLMRKYEEHTHFASSLHRLFTIGIAVSRNYMPARPANPTHG